MVTGKIFLARIFLCYTVLMRNYGIVAHNMRVFYFVDTFRALWFVTSIWVAFELQYISLSQLTMIEAVILGVNLLVQLPTGAFADLFGKRITMIIGMIGFALAMALYANARDFPGFLVYAALVGIAEACIDGTREALLYDTLKQEHHEQHFSSIASKLSIVFQLALAVATFSGGWIGMYSYEAAIWASVGGFLLAAVASWFYREPAIDTERFTVRNYIRKTRQGIGEIFKNGYVKKISLYYILIGSITWVCMLTFNMVLLAEMKFTTSQIGMTIASIRILNSVFLFGLIGKTGLFNRQRTFIVLPVIFIVSTIPVMFITKWFAILPILGTMFVSMARWNLVSRYTNAEFASRNRATAISVLCMIIGIFYVAVVGSSGYVMERFGGIRVIYTALGVFAVFTVLPLGIHLAKNHA